MELTEEQEMELIDKHKKNLICPKCESELFNKDYKINKKTLIYFLSIFLMGLIGGFVLKWAYF